jgi:hypothetical protein
MILLKHQQFLGYVRDYVSIYPEAGAYVAEYVANGIDAARRDALQRAADLEMALAAVRTTLGEKK